MHFDTAYSISTENHGILTAFEARKNGIASKDLARWVKIGRFIKLGNGVYKSTQYPSSEDDPYAIAVAQCGRGAYLCGESVLGFLRLMPTSVDRINVRIPRRLRRRLPDGYVVSVGKLDYKPININGVMCQKPVDAIRACFGIVMSERLIQASESAYTNGYIDKSELERLKKEICDQLCNRSQDLQAPFQTASITTLADIDTEKRTVGGDLQRAKTRFRHPSNRR